MGVTRSLPPLPDHNLLLAKIQVFHPQFQAFGLAKATAIKDLHNQSMNASHLSEDSFDFFGSENGGEILRLFGADGIDAIVQFQMQDMAIEEKQGTEGLILGRG
jgi:hypothetical protein